MTRQRLVIAVTAALLFGGVFVLLPALAAQLSDSLSLPCWRVLPLQVLGTALMLAAVGVYAYCASLFSLRGRGTPSPFYPPGRLVAAGLFAYSRNPIYVGYVAFLVGVFFFFGHLGLLIYAVLVAASLQILIVYWEEPDLRRRFDRQYDAYTQAVPRWIGLPRAASPLVGSADMDRR